MEWAWGVLEGSHEEVRALSALAVPSVMSNFLEGGLGVVDVMMLGYLGKGHLASLSVGNAFFNIFWYFIEGFLTAQDTLASNAHGAGDAGSVRQWTYISLFSTLVLCACTSVSFFFVQEILGTIFWMPFHLKTKAAVHVYLLSPGLWFLAGSRVLQKYFQAQNQMLPGLFASLVANGVNIACNYLFIFYFEFGFAGCGLATSVARLAALLSLAWSVKRSGQWPVILSELRGLGRDPAVAGAVRGVGGCARRLGCCSAGALGHAYRALGVRAAAGRRGGADDDDDDDDDEEEAEEAEEAEEEAEEEGEEGEEGEDRERSNDEGGIEMMTPGQQKAARHGGKRAPAPASAALKTKPKPGAAVGSSSRNPIPSRAAGGEDGSSDGSSDEDSVMPRSAEPAGPSSSSSSSSSSGFVGAAAVARRRRLALVRTARFALLGIPGGLMMGLDSWIFVALSFFVAQMGTVPLATHEVMAMFTCFVFLSLPFALSVAATIRVSQLLAARRPAQARFSTFIVLAASAVVLAAAGTLVLFLPDTLGSVFTDDPDVLYRLSRISPILAGFQVAYGLQGVAQGVLRGMGRQGEVAGFTLLCVWGLGLPAGLFMGFYARPTLGFDGLWGGLLLGMGCLAVVLLLLVLVSHWERESRRALLRADVAPAAAAAAGADGGFAALAATDSAPTPPPRAQGRAAQGADPGPGVGPGTGAGAGAALIGQPRPGSLSRGGFPLQLPSLEMEMDELELLEETERAASGGGLV